MVAASVLQKYVFFVQMHESTTKYYTLSLVYKGHDLQGSLVKILSKIGVRSKCELDKQF